jgi:hypothetical protein
VTEFGAKKFSGADPIPNSKEIIIAKQEIIDLVDNLFVFGIILFHTPIKFIKRRASFSNK